MKNKFLLLGATALLSTSLAMDAMAEIAEAGRYSVLVHADAALVNDFEVKETQRLNFGQIMKPKGGQTVIVKNDSTIDQGTTANVKTNLVKAGQITLYNAVQHTIGNNLSILSTSIVLKSNDITCGTATINSAVSSYGVIPEGVDNISVNYGGELTIDANIETNMGNADTLQCTGQGTITVIHYISA